MLTDRSRSCAWIIGSVVFTEWGNGFVTERTGKNRLTLNLPAGQSLRGVPSLRAECRDFVVPEW